MRRLLTVLALCAGIVSAQTSINCTAAGFCGDLTSGGGTSGGNHNLNYGVPFAVTTSLNVTDIKIRMGNTPTGTTLALLVLDTNTSGSTIATGTVLCSATVVNPTANAVATFTVSGCGTLVTGKRYWILFNNNNSSIDYSFGSSNPTAYYNSNTCCTPPATVTGAMSADAAGLDAGIDLASPGGGTVHNQFPRIQ